MSPIAYIVLTLVAQGLQLVAVFVGASVAAFGANLGWRAAERLLPKKSS